MPILVHSCKSLPPLCDFFMPNEQRFIPCLPKFSYAKTHISNSVPVKFSWNSSILRSTHVSFCSKNEVLEELTTTQLPPESKNEFELLSKPSPKSVDSSSLSQVEAKASKPDREEVLEPFYKFFRPRDSLEQQQLENPSNSEKVSEEIVMIEEEDKPKKVCIEYYEPKLGDFVVGVVVSGNENKLDVNIGADMLGTMLTKEVLPLYDKELDSLLCDSKKDAEEFMVKGKMGILRNEDALSGEPGPGRPVLEPGTVLYAEVLGRTLSGRPLLSTRRLFRRLAWHRVRQIKQLDMPVEVKITEWNTGGLLTRIEGLRAFLPKTELVNRVNNFTELKENVGRRIHVQITRISEDTNDLILSEKEAWNSIYLKEGTLLEGTVKKILPYGAQIRIGESNRSGLLHISNITRGRISSVNDLLAVNEKVKALVVKSMFPNKISLSTAELESEPGLFLSDKERVFSEAEEMAKKYRQKLPAVSGAPKLEPLPIATFFKNEEDMYANWKWFEFEDDNVPE